MTHIDLADHERAVADLAHVMAGLRQTPGRVGIESAAREVVESASDGGAFLLAMVTPDGADPALLTGVVLEVPDGWDTGTAEGLRDAMENVGGPDVQDSVALTSLLGPAVVAQRVPGVEQERGGEPMVLQLQGFVVDPAENRMLLLTLAAPSAGGWPEHQRLFTAVLTSASPDGADEDEPFEVRPVPL
ncbi:MAG: hypothetical protein ACRDQB_02665 [Thermocrispum sp.]